MRAYLKGCYFFIGILILIYSNGVSADKLIYQDPEVPLSLRVADLLARMTLAEKVGQLNMPCVYVRELGDDITSKSDACKKFAGGTLLEGIGPGGGFFTLANTILHQGPQQQAKFFNELQEISVQKTRLGIPLLQMEEGTHGLMCSGATIFPEGLALGSSWNMDLIEQIYSVAAKEARAVGIHQLFTLVIEPNRDPRLGRNQEGYSEDPYFCSEIAKAIVKGAQGRDASFDNKVVAGLCHYPGQSQPVGGLEQGAMEISERVLRETFLPPWVAGIKEAGALGVMVTYPSIDGEPAHGSKKLLTRILREELGFKGLVLSEGGGFRWGLIGRKIASTQKEAGALAIKAGVDVSITFEDAFLKPLIENVQEGKVSIKDINRAVSRILEIKLRQGLFENPYVDPNKAITVSHTREHQQLALRAAREGIVLLKNENNLLPLQKNINSIAVIGPNANHQRNLLGDYTSEIILQKVVTVLEGIQRKLSPQTRIEYVKGCDVLATDLDEIQKAAEVAANSEVAVVVVGENERFAPNGAGTNGEHKDVASLDLTGRQEELVKEVYHSGTPTIVVLINGRPLSIRWIADNIPAVVEAWLPGEAGGQAVADILFGDYNPDGHLPITIPRHSGQLPFYYNYMPSRKQTAERKGVGYIDLPHSPLYEFGFGLSYTSFEYSDLKINPQKTGLQGTVEVSLSIKNNGPVPGAEVVQLYLNDVVSSLTTPIRQLKRFKKVFLKPGEQRSVSFLIYPDDLSFVNFDMERIVEPGKFEVMVGCSSEDIRLQGSFILVQN